LILTGPLATGRAMARHRLKEQRDRRDQPYCAINVIDIIDMILYSYHTAETKRDTHVADRWRAQLKLRNSVDRIAFRGWRTRLRPLWPSFPSRPPSIVKLSESSVARWSASRNMSHGSPDRLNR